MSSSHTIFIDDSETDKITYRVFDLGPFRGKSFVPYTETSTSDAEGPIHDGTLRRADFQDLSAAVTFTGIRVSVYGSLRPPVTSDASPPLTKYSVPDSDYAGIPAMVPYQAPRVTSPKNNVNFFTSDVLPYDTHILTINVSTASSSAPFYLDYIAVEVPGPDPSTSTSTSKTTATPEASPAATDTTGASSSFTFVTATSTRSSSAATAITDSASKTNSASASETSASTLSGHSTPPPSSTTDTTQQPGSTDTTLPVAASSRKSSVPVGGIVGAVIGVVLLLALAIFLFIRWWRRYRAVAEYKYGDECTAAQKDGQPSVEPYVDPRRGVGELGLLFAPGQPSNGSQSSSRDSSRPVSPEKKSSVTPATPEPSEAQAEAGSSTSPPQPSVPLPNAGKRKRKQRNPPDGATSPSTHLPSSGPSASGVVDAPPGVVVHGPPDSELGPPEDEEDEEDELPPVYSRNPLPGENYSAEILTSAAYGAIGKTPGLSGS